MFKHRGIMLIIGLFVLTRLLFIFTSEYAYHGEESKQSSLAVDIIRGDLKLPFFGYLDAPHSGGSIFTSLVAIPFFLVLGNTFFAQKVTALVFSLLTLILLIKIVQKKYPMIIVYLLGGFFCFSPPHYLQKSVMHQGNLVEMIFFLVLAIYICYNVFFENKRSFLRFIALGFVCGLGFWIQYGQLTAIVTILIFWYAFDKLFFIRKQFLSFLISLAGGLSPWIYYNVKYDFASFTSDTKLFVNAAGYIQQIANNLNNRLSPLLLIELPKSFHFLDFSIISAQTFDYTFYFILIILILLLVWIDKTGVLGFLKSLFPVSKFNLKRETSNLAVLILVFLSISILMFSLSGYLYGGLEAREWSSMNYQYHQYILFFQPFIFLLSSIALGKMLVSGNKIKKMLAMIMLVLLVGIAMIGFFSVISFNNFNRYLFRPVYAVNSNAMECGFNYSLNLKLFKRFSEEIDVDLRESFFRGAGRHWSYFVREGSIDKGTFRETLYLMNSKEKRAFFYDMFFKVNMDIHDRGGRDFELIDEVYNRVLKTLNDEERLICQEAFIDFKERSNEINK